jgi:hypothetical protein
VIFIGVLCFAVGIGSAVFWEEAAIRYHLHRLRTEPDYLRAVVLDRVAREDAWAPALGSDRNYIVEFVEYHRHPRHSLAWAAVDELMKSEEGRKAVVRALESMEFEKAIVAGVEDLRRRVLQEDLSPRQ